jgi:hypothetical protein
MGIMSRQTSAPNSPTLDMLATEEKHLSETSTKCSLGSTSSEDTPSSPPSPSRIPEINGWTLPFESLVLKNRGPDVDLPLNFLKIYPAIMRKFGGAPCDALGRTVTYFQSLFTESPAFHPYIMHLPFGRVPKTEAEGLIVATALEKELIRVVQHLLAFFYSDVQAVVRYINDCPAELIPRPCFVIAEERPVLNNGVDGYNNQHPGGQKMWQNPLPASLSQLQQGNEALRVNLVRCIEWVSRKQTPRPRSCPPERIAQRPLPPPPQQPRVMNFTPPPPPPPPMPLQPAPPMPFMQPPMQAPIPPPSQMGPFAVQLPAPQSIPAPPPPPPTRAPIIFASAPLPQPMQAPVQAPQPSPIPFVQHPRGPVPVSTVVRQPPPPPPATSSLKDDISRIEAQMTRLLDLVSKGQGGP